MSEQQSQRPRGIGRVLVVVYAILAIAATGRSVYQIISKFDEAPVAYALSAVAAVVYIVATIGLALGRRGAPIAWAAVSFELVGVLAVGVLSLTHPELFAHPSVWSTFGMGYLFIPLVLPFLGIWWLVSRRCAVAPTPAAAV
ncbi:MAG: hypothetical protein ABW204_05265 [Microbacteriaceae bacterium]